MDFDSIEGLSKSEIEHLYEEQINFENISDCYCRNGSYAGLCLFLWSHNIDFDYNGEMKGACESWCKLKGSGLESFYNYCSNEVT